jgi:hypothetical protein
VPVLHVGTLVANELQVGRLRQFASETLTRPRSAAIGGAAAAALVLGLILLGGFGHVEAANADPAVAQAPHFAPATETTLPPDQWVAIDQLIAGRSYLLEPDGRTKLRFGHTVKYFDEEIVFNAKHHDILKVRSMDGRWSGVIFHDLGPTLALERDRPLER